MFQPHNLKALSKGPFLPCPPSLAVCVHKCLFVLRGGIHLTLSFSQMAVGCSQKGNYFGRRRRRIMRIAIKTKLRREKVCKKHMHTQLPHNCSAYEIMISRAFNEGYAPKNDYYDDASFPSTKINRVELLPSCVKKRKGNMNSWYLRPTCLLEKSNYKRRQSNCSIWKFGRIGFHISLEFSWAGKGD